MEREAVLGAILAGGLSRRMGGGDKALLPLAGRPVLAHVIERLAPQVGGLILNANGDPARWAGFGLPVAADSLAGHPGPLAGLLAALDWAAERAPGREWLACAPCDAPFLPRDLVRRLAGALAGGRAAVAASGGRRHPVAGLYHVGLRAGLRGFLAAGGRRAGEWAERIGAGVAEFPVGPVDPFFNLNTPEQLARAERLVVDCRGQGDDR
jgi:molybdopterin-guanine dinucleotide biosynthesis protein A